ncbi:hypothetical protein AOQ84DRAFT_345944 [Glonium stellatum]|uniref:UBC core domain-containing protein n=1 Tax=Glonium stellatum TaxID=574774 RepID=A0A8E2JPV5_9PEZI|nr:hypothetical protein AOQ84DRAFT_345944 [Glonium stellatum]
MAEQAAIFCVEDTCGLKSDKYMIGVIDRTFGDVDSHEPLPQRDYGDDIQRHQDLPRAHFLKFMKTGIPPRGTVLVSWQTEFKTELVPESELELLDRALFVGDVVKKDARSPMSGTVIGTKAICTLFPAGAFDGNPEQITRDVNVRGVPADELQNVHEYNEGALVVYDDWVGRIEDVYDEISVRLSNGSVVVVENWDELDPDDPLVDRLSIGDTVKTKKGNLRRGRWKYGAFNPNIRPHGTVVDTRTTNINVRWLGRRIGAVAASTVEPTMELNTDVLESGNLYVYDTTRGPAKPTLAGSRNEESSYHIADVTVGDRVRFKDLTAACVKYDGTRTLPNGLPQGKVERIPRTETQGYDMNVYLIMQTQTTVTVLWQDLSISENTSTSLIPDPNVDDDDEVWPGEIVCTKEKAVEQAESDWAFRPAKVGVVQSVRAIDRIATVRWFTNAEVRFHGEDLLPPSQTGTISTQEEDVSLYDIRSTAGLTRRRGDFVILHPDVHMENMESSNREVTTNGTPYGPEWFGEIIDLGLDGKLTVRLGVSRPVRDVRVAPERVTLVYSSDMDAHLDEINASVDDDDYEDMDEDEDEDDSGFDTESINYWIEYEGHGGERIDRDGEDAWSTEEEDEDEDDDGDVSMSDIPAEVEIEIDTSKTTPESQPEDESSAPTNRFETEPAHGMDSESVPRSEQTQTTTLPSESLASPTLDSFALTNNPNAPVPFLVLDTQPPLDHHYMAHAIPGNSTHTRRIAKEHKILRTSLPPGIFVRTWESRLDLLRVLIIGPSDTPYEFAPFLIDIHLGASFPSSPPEAYFHSWTNGNGPVNPNLYEDGKICLSLLGTWHADERNENWSPARSTVLQVLVSLMGLVLVKEPYYNEAGYDIRLGSPETSLPSALYTERAYFRARAFIVHALTTPTHPFIDELKWLYLDQSADAPKLLQKAVNEAKAIIERSGRKDEQRERDGLRRISLGAVVMLKRQVEKLEELRGLEFGAESRQVVGSQ